MPQTPENQEAPERLGAQLRVEDMGGGRFQPSPSGVLCHILNVETWRGEIIDYVAWPVDNELRWWTRWGTGILLGENSLCRADWRNEPIVLWQTPADWLRAELAKPGNHCCIIDWSCDVRAALVRAPEIKCATVPTQTRLVAALNEAAVPNVKITVARNGR